MEITFDVDTNTENNPNMMETSPSMAVSITRSNVSVASKKRKILEGESEDESGEDEPSREQSRGINAVEQTSTKFYNSIIPIEDGKVREDRTETTVVTINDPMGFNNLLSIISSVIDMNSLVLNVTSKDFMGIKIDFIAPTTAIVAQFACEVSGIDDSFAVPGGILKSLLESVLKRSTLVLIKYMGEETLSGFSVPESAQYQEMNFTIPLKVVGAEQQEFAGLSNSFTFEIDLYTMKQIMKLASSIQVEDISIKVMEMNDPRDRESREAVPNDDDHSQIFLVFGVEKDGVKCAKNYHCAKKDSKGSDMQVYSILNTSDYEVVELQSKHFKKVFDQLYAAKKIDSFLKYVKMTKITLMLGCSGDKGDNDACMFRVDVGESSYVNYILAARVEEDPM